MIALLVAVLVAALVFVYYIAVAIGLPPVVAISAAILVLLLGVPWR